MLFTTEHIRMSRQGRKTQTRRMWKKPRARVGSIHQMRRHLFGRSQGRIQIKGVHQEHLLDITEEDAWKEGEYTRECYLRKWFEINPKSPPNPSLYVVDYRYIKL